MNLSPAKRLGMNVCPILLSLVFYSCVSFAQTSQNDPEYSKEWIKVEAFIEKGLPQSALEVVEQIISTAKQSGNQPQMVKAVIYKVLLSKELSESSEEEAIALLTQVSKQAPFPASSLYHSILAELYWGYYESHRYEWLNRTVTTEEPGEDMKTWDLKTLGSKVIEHHLVALEQPERLQHLQLKDYNAILDQEKNSKIFRPTLYDFIVHRALDRFTSDETYLTRPAHDFEISDPAYLSPFQDFIELQLDAQYASSMKYQAMKLFQDLLAFHRKDSDPTALIDADLKRIQFVREQAVFPGVDSLYLAALDDLSRRFESCPFTSYVQYQKASFLESLGERYEPLKSVQYKWERKKAADLCRQVLAKFPEAQGAAHCQVLLDRLTNPELSLTTDNVLVPGKPFLGLLEFRNTDKLYWKMVPFDPSEERNLRQAGDMKKTLQSYLNVNPIQSGSFDLPSDGDLQPHKIQIPFPALGTGYYILLLCSDPVFDFGKKAVYWSSVWVSNLSLVEQKTDKRNDQIFVLDRSDGKPLQGVTVEAWTNEFDQGARKRVEKVWRTFVTDKEGGVLINFPDERGYKSFYLSLKKGNDRYITDSYFYLNGQSGGAGGDKQLTYIFTDRAIYRPGQTIYFKGIMIEGQGKEYHVREGVVTTVGCYNANGKKITELNLKSNQYGSFNGSFTAPGGMTGRINISNESGSVVVSVEEYKRPRFEVTLEQPEGNYRLNAQVRVKGKAETYAGNPVDAAKGTFRVVRRTDFPYFRDFGYWFPISEETQIATGDFQTDAMGRFTIDFKAIPDLQIDKKYQPVFHYEVSVDVTDINGETRSVTDNVPVAYHCLNLETNLRDEVNKDVPVDVKLKTTNLSGKFLSSSGTWTVYRLKPFDRIFRPMKWDCPDTFLMKKDAFRNQFPEDLWKNENEADLRERAEKVMDMKYQTPKDTLVRMKDLGKWVPGEYVLEVVSKDSFGETVRYTRYFSVYSLKEKKLGYNACLWSVLPEGPVEPGDSVMLMFGTRYKKARLMLQVLHNNQEVDRKWLDISDEIVRVPLIIKETDRGNLMVQALLVHSNRCYESSGKIRVPFTNKELKVSYETFRDHLSPGQKEEWKLHLTGNKKEQIAAELVLSMYDASLDAFTPHKWSMDLYGSWWNFPNWQTAVAFGMEQSNESAFHREYSAVTPWYQSYDRLIKEDLLGGGGGGYRYPALMKSGKGEENMMVMADATIAYDKVGESDLPPPEELENKVKFTVPVVEEPVPEVIPAVRRDLKETAFFFPALETDEKGDVIVRFTVPESLTRWKMLGLAHTKDLRSVIFEKEAVTSKELMVFPNPPRFVREGDTLTFSVKISSMTDQILKGSASLLLFDALTMKPLGAELGLTGPAAFSLPARQSQEVSWNLHVPHTYAALIWRVEARAGDFTDAEESMIPVLSNRMLVTETLPLPIRGKGTFSFDLQKLEKQSAAPSKTLTHHKLSLEFASNPIWYAIQALPYLMEDDVECSERIFSRFYANSLASFIARSNPSIKRVFDTWSKLTPSALLSNLEKNQDLKNLVLEETPWLMDARDESERKQRIALLFEVNRMSDETARALDQLRGLQSVSGGWPWFQGLPDDRYITQYIMTGMGHLQRIGVLKFEDDQDYKMMVRRGVGYMDEQMKEEYKNLLKYASKNLDDNHLNQNNIQYLYARSFYMRQFPLDANYKETWDYFVKQARKYWTSQNPYLQAMLSLALFRTGDEKTAKEMIRSLNERSLNNKELGMYWKDMSGGYYWYHNAIQSQALLIEAFDEVAGDIASVEGMKTWLLKQKQTNNWKTTTATADACYALLLRGVDQLGTENKVEIMVGKERVTPGADPAIQLEAGTGYFRTSWSSEKIQPEMGKVEVTTTEPGVAWGALYWQYFEDLDKITRAESPLKVDRKLFIRRDSPSGPQLEPVTEGCRMKVGDKITVRITLSNDRDLEYVHLKDLRAAGLEPVDVMTGYHYQEGLGYIQSTRDAATNFFLPYLPKGTRIFEYTLVASMKGEFSEGVCQAQCLYAPEFGAHSSGLRIKID